MIYTKKKTTCVNPSCTKTRVYGVPGGTRKYCRKHAEVGMIDVSHRSCIVQDCKKQANYGKHKYCSEHKPHQAKEDSVDSKPADTLTAALVEAATSHHESEGWWKPSESPVQPSASTAPTPSAAEGREQPRKPAPPSAATTDKDKGAEGGSAPLFRQRPLLQDAFKLFKTHSQTALQTSLATTSCPSATTKATPKPVAASPEVGEGEGVDAAPGAVEEISALFSAACLQDEGESGAASVTDIQGEGQGVAAAAVVDSECDGDEEEAHLVDRFGHLTTAAEGLEGEGEGGEEAAETAMEEEDTHPETVDGQVDGGGITGSEAILRRSSRVPGSSALEFRPVVDLVDKIRADDAEVEVLKIHNHISADVSPSVVDALLGALMLNSNCQALYIQNVSLRDEQLRKLAEVLRRGNIWCLNAGENSGISSSAWWWFVEEIKHTNVTVSVRSMTCDVAFFSCASVRNLGINNTS